jgi:lipoprotein-anchoring transpeptidase ErfK/SrfK
MRATWMRILIGVAITGGVVLDSTPAAAQSATAVARRVVVSVPHRKLALMINGQVVRTFPVAVGAPHSPSPAGEFTIVNRLSQPTYYRPGKVIGPGPSNPLGTRWIGFDRKGYGIHGTDDPDSIGYARSHGCIRLRNRDVEQLFDLLRVGDVVELQNEPTSEMAALFGNADSSVTSPTSEDRQ